MVCNKQTKKLLNQELSHVIQYVQWPFNIENVFTYTFETVINTSHYTGIHREVLISVLDNN